MEKYEKEAMRYHLQALEAALREFIKRAPEFAGDKELAAVCGHQMANLWDDMQKVG